MEKRFIFIFLAITILSINLASAASPVLFFSDLTSGPNTGGKDNKGVFVTIFGKNFGSSRGSSYVTVGGGVVDNYPVWGENNAANPNLDMITFQLGANAQTGDIIVHTSDGDSNALPFIVRAGRIFFVDINSPNNPGSGTYTNPWRSPTSYYNSMQAGDTCYIRGGTYTDKYHGGGSHSQISLNRGVNGGANNEIAWVAYPGETAIFNSSIGDGNVDFYISTTSYYVFSGFHFYAPSNVAYMTGYNNRFINNDCEGLKYHAYAILSPASGTNGFKIYSNTLHGAKSGNKLDHPLYIGYGSSNVDFGWNWIYDNDVAEGPLISTNQDGYNSLFSNNLIHDNILDCRNSSRGLRAIGFVAQKSGSNAKVYNNILINSGGDVWWNYAVYIYTGSVDFYNNVLYNVQGVSGGAAIAIEGTEGHYPETVRIKNNIIYSSTSVGGYFTIADESSMALLDINYNNYYGIGNGPARDTYAINADPLFVNAANGNFHLQSNSPAIDVGADVSSIATRDYDGISRPQGSGFDIGAYEYVTSEPIQYHPADTNQNNKIEMKELIAFIARWKNSEVNVNDVLSALDRWFRGS